VAKTMWMSLTSSCCNADPALKPNPFFNLLSIVVDSRGTGTECSLAGRVGERYNV
jgi:hypothetical protein